MTDDELHEATTQGGSAWRDRLAQRHRYGRALDLPPARPLDDRPVGIYAWGLAGFAFWLAALLVGRALGWY